LRAVIFANGNLNSPNKIRSQIRADDLVIAADGGARHCRELNLHPHLVIGDMDSISSAHLDDLRIQDTQLLIYPEDKDQTDLELALSYALEKGVNEVLLFGLLGGRLDLSLTNLLLLARDEWGEMSLIVKADPDIAYLMRDQDAIFIDGNPGDTISLIPLSECVTQVSTQGLRWQLDEVDLFQGNTLSVSNELLETSARIQVGVGKMMLVHRDMLAAKDEE
jgi:thiamine pyrophosphokinase